MMNQIDIDKLQRIADGKEWSDKVLDKAIEHADTDETDDVLRAFLRDGGLEFGPRMVISHFVCRMQATLNKTLAVKSEDQARYETKSRKSANKAEVLEKLDLLYRFFENELDSCSSLESPTVVKAMALAKIGKLEHEEFYILHLNAKNKLIEFEMHSKGTLDTASVYPREVLKSVLAHNSKAVILAHNHPSGSVTPSEADKNVTQKIKEALKLIDVSVLDHIIVASSGNTLSFAEEGLL